MSNWSGGVLTNVGRELQLKVEAGATLTFTKIKLGDGIESLEAVDDLTDLMSPKFVMGISSKSVANDVCKITGVLSSSSIATGFRAREWGLFAQDPDIGEILYMISIDTQPDWVPSGSDIGKLAVSYAMNVAVSNASSITARIDPAGLVTADMLAELIHETQYNKSYNVGDYAFTGYGLPAWAYLECIQEGISGTIELDLSNVVEGEHINDGTVVWIVRNWHSIHQYLVEATGYGIVSGLQVKAQDTPNMTVSIEGGTVHMKNGTRIVIAAIAALTIAAADATNPRIDSIYVDGTGNVAYAQGTPAATPVVPTLSTDAIKLADVKVAANQASVTEADIVRDGEVLPRFYNTGVVNVKDFGAKGDGVTDDTAAIQAAIDSVAGNFTNAVGNEKIAINKATIFIPKGVYLLSAPIVLSADTSLIGAGRNSTMLKSSSAMDDLLIYGGHTEGQNLVSKNLEIANITLNCDGNAKIGLSNRNNVWIESANIHDICILRASELGIDISSTWLSLFSNITIKGCPVGAYCGGNDSNNGCNDNTIINLSINNSSLINIIIASQCCNFIGLNVDRQKDYLQSGAIVANSVVIHGNTYSDNAAILATTYCDCNKIDGLWFEWISQTSNTPVLLVKDINTYSNGHFKSIALQICNIHSGGYYQDIFKILSGHIVIDNCRLDIPESYSDYVVDTQGADSNTSLLLKGMMMSAFTAWLNSGKTRITLPYGAFRAEGTLSNGTYKTYQPKSQNGYIAEDTSINMLESIDSNGFITKMINSGVYEKVSKSGYKMEINQFFIGFYNKLPEGATASTTVTTSIPVESGVIWTGMVVPRNLAGMTAIKNGYYLDIDTSGTYLTVTLRFSTALPSGNPNIHVVLFPFSAT
ncbi:glycosyl hydrolase family 28-related protein [Selenomonas ruminantium]|uniref:glycosyl hydrolase family 28-related protein n=1 Tax=Selenomonas ruminantium TaxID=971 RepID=UPI000420CA36|nr:glycosyl hydrolase family 28-related protein [Selenomonas ruminantium]